MRFVGISMVKNEADVIEWFVRHNTQKLDWLVVLDHASSDETRQILHALKQEGLPISLHRDATPGYPQSDIMTKLMRVAVANHGADWVVPLDADEFIRFPSHIGQATDWADATAPILSTWHNYVPDSVASDRLQDVARIRLPVSGIPGRKVIVPRHLAENERFLLHAGSHALLERHGDRGRSVEARIVEALTLAHLPFRTLEQLVAKAVNGYLAHRVSVGAEAKKTGINSHWRVLAQAIMAGEAVAWSDLPGIIGRAYQSMPDSYDGTDLVLDPLDTDVERKHPFRTRSASSLIASWCDSLLDSVVR